MVQLGPRTEFIKRYWVFAVIVAVRALFVVTFPPNFGGDAINYYTMLTEWRSNLMHAPGYPFLMGLPWRNPLGRAFISSHPVLFPYVLVAIQHVVVVLVLVVVHRTLAARLGLTAASLAVLLYGVHWQALGAASCIYPEWLQACLFLVAGALVLRAFDAANPSAKVALYGLAGVPFAWAYLAKYNTLILLPLLLLPLLLDGLPARRKALSLGLAAGLGAGNVAAFVVGFHQPSTGSYALTYDKAWVLLVKVKSFVPDGRLRPSAGPNSKRLLLLNELLPWDKDVGPIWHVDYGPPGLRRKYRQRFGYLLTADERTLDELLLRTTLRADFDLATAWHPTGKYLGLRESDALGVKVYLENVRRYPAAFARTLAAATYESFSSSPLHPFYPVVLPERRLKKTGAGFFAYVHQRPQPFWTRPYHYQQPYLWLPGVRLFTALGWAFYLVPSGLVSLLLGARFAAEAVAGLRSRRWPWARTLYVALGLSLVAYIVGSNMILFYRWKEAVLALPLICIMVAMCLADRWPDLSPRRHNPRAMPDGTGSATAADTPAADLSAILGSLYRRRFSPEDLAEMREVWRVLVRDFFQHRIRAGATVADVGAGPCLFINEVRAERRIAIDANSDVLRHAAPGVEAHVAEDLSLRELSDGSVTHLFLSNFLEHLPDYRAVLSLLSAARRKLEPGGTLLVLQPNFRLAPRRYFDFLDHQVILTDRSLVEALEVVGLRITELRVRFLPLTSKSRLPKWPWAVALFLRLRPLQWLLGAQTFVVAQRPPEDQRPAQAFR